MNQLARLSALTAIRSVGRWAVPALRSQGRLCSTSCSISATVSTWRSSWLPSGVATHGVARFTRMRPVRSSSWRTRCDSAEGVRCRARAARSKLPSRTTAARAVRAA